MLKWIEWIDGEVPVARWLLLVFVITMLFEIVTVIHAIMKK